jgi:uncharacterized membrane protein YecN with MAPEG domain
MGNGQLGRLLDYPSWHRLARAQRAHYNALENATPLIVLTLLAGLALPIPAAVFGFIIVLGRLLYGWGYRKWGASGRVYGVILVDLSLLAQLGMAIYSGVAISTKL